MLCPELVPKVICFHGFRLIEGMPTEEFPFHVPAHRISRDHCVEAIRTHVAVMEGWPGEFIVHSLMNERGADPEVYPRRRIVVDHPEPGVTRWTTSATNSWAWFERVEAVDNFRKG